MKIISDAIDVPARARAEVYLTLPSAFSGPRILYVGASDRVGGFKFQDQLEEATFLYGAKVWIVEPWKPYCDWLRRYQRWIHAIENMDIFSFHAAEKFDAVIFWHGPEHVAPAALPKLFDHLESMSYRYIIVGAPWGEWPQEIGKDKNPWQQHRSELGTVFLESRGYHVTGVEYHAGCPPAADNGKNAKGHLVAWKEL